MVHPGPWNRERRASSVDIFALTSTNITYSVYGGSFRYWDCFPAREEGGVSWGHVPVWGFGDVIESTLPEVPVSTRVYGFFTMADEVVVQPGRFDDRGFTDMFPHRRAVPSVYSRYSIVASDPAYQPDREAQHILLWPLFVTSFVIDDFLWDNGFFGANTVVVSSASAKTAIGAAFLMADRKDLTVIGLTSEANVTFVRSLGLYADVVTYESIDSLPVRDAIYIDFAGRRDVARSLHSHFGNHLRYSMIAGDTHWDDKDDRSQPRDALVGPRPTFLFAPDQIAKRRREWGREGFEDKVTKAWGRFVRSTDRWMRIELVTGPESVERSYQEILAGKVDPQVGNICTLLKGANR